MYECFITGVYGYFRDFYGFETELVAPAVICGP